MSRRAKQSIVTVALPLPPSVNKAFTARRGSHLTAKSAAYKFWLREVADEHGGGEKLPRLISGAYGMWIDLPGGMLGDIDNRVKLLSDMLRTAGNEHCLCIVDDDKNMAALYVQRELGVPKGRCIVSVVSLADWHSYVEMRLL